jgi:hypothetical protein
MHPASANIFFCLFFALLPTVCPEPCLFLVHQFFNFEYYLSTPHLDIKEVSLLYPKLLRYRMGQRQLRFLMDLNQF